MASAELAALAAAPMSLVISTRNRPAFVAAAVAAVLEGRPQPDEIVVVDQSDRPHATLGDPAATPPCVRYIWSERRGLSRGRNDGIRAARHELLAFIDDDVLVQADWLEAFRQALLAADGPRTVITGRVLEGHPEQPGGFAPSTRSTGEPAVYRGRVGADVLLPNCMLVPRRAFEEVGSFDERLGAGARFPSSEDNDFGYRLLEAGYQIVYAPQVIARHRAWRAPRAAVPLRFDYGRGQGAYYAKHLAWSDRYMARRLWWDVRRHVRRAPRRAFVDARAAAGDVVYALAVVLGALEWLVTVGPRRPGREGGIL